MEKDLGGKRLGSGSKMSVQMRNYERSTHDLSKTWMSSASPGTLIPFMKLVALNGDTFDIDLNAMVRTVPTIAPLFGSFKLQLDVFEVPMRLYNGLLHNNAINIGMDMSQVLIPKLALTYNAGKKINNNLSYSTRQINPSSLISYMGFNGIGHVDADYEFEASTFLNAIPFLAYYDIAKNYYCNKQEENAYVITTNISESVITKVVVEPEGYTSSSDGNPSNGRTNEGTGSRYDGTNPADRVTTTAVTYTGETLANITIPKNAKVSIYFENAYVNDEGTECNVTFKSNNEVLEIVDDGLSTKVQYLGRGSAARGSKNINGGIVFFANGSIFATETDVTGITFQAEAGYNEIGSIKLQEFPLENIDEMRENILKATGKNSAIEINAQSKLPYSVLVEKTTNDNSKNLYSQNGLMIKTYQSDLFNNWLQTDWIDGVNGISAVTAVDTSEGSFKIDALNLAQKVYNMLNRIAVSGGSYEDWQEAVYGEDAIRRAESPIYCGGMQSEIVFEEIVSTAATSDPLGTLAGKGTLIGKKGGNITIKVKEPSYIIGIMSITPRVCYSQGNEWDLSLNSINDLHKPALDGIGFQELMTEQMAWWDVHIANGGELTKFSAGKQPAWLNYMTSYNEVYGTFADPDKAGYTVLRRNYEQAPNGRIKDLTTYIDPTKYNYAFASQELEEQNFWVQIGINIQARRKMSAKIIPNL